MPLPCVIFVNRVYWPAPAATAQLLTDLAEGLTGRGWPVEVVAAGESSARRNGVIVHRTGPGEHQGGLLARALNHRRFLRAADRRLASLVRPGDVVVPMTDPPMLGAKVSAIAAARGGQVVHWIQDVYPEIVPAHFGGWAALPLTPLRARRDAAWRSARACVALGADMAQAVAGRGVPPERIPVVPNWAPRELHASATADDIAARRATWELTGKFVVAYSGNLGRVHEFSAVLDAAERLRGRSEIVFLFIGHGARLEEIRSVIRSRQLGNVRLLPPEPLQHLAVALAAADVQLVTLKPAFARLVYPSKLAGVLAAGRAVLFVGPTDGEIAELLSRERCGAAFAPADGEGLARMLEQWQADPAGLASFGQAARRTYETHFTFEASLAKWENVLRQAALV